jgi:tetratricopeptide (TPR) repeat protein
MSDNSLDSPQTSGFVRDNIVKIVNNNGEFFGTGFCLEFNQKKYFITCHHCIYNLDQIFIEKDSIQYSCKWIEEYSDINKDLAVLKCDDENLPVKPLNYNPKALPKLEVIVLGFATGELENIPAGRSIEDLRLASYYNFFKWKAEEPRGNKKWNNKPEVNLNVYQIQGEFEQGFSGAPVCYTWDNNVIGIFTARTDNNGYVIPIQTLLQKFNKNSEILAAQNNINTKEYLEKGNLFYDKRKFKEALIQYDEIIKDVNYLSALSNKGRSLAQLGENKKALEIFNLVLDINSNFVYALLGMSAIFFNQGKYQEAIDWCDKVLAIDPNNVVSLSNKGIALKKQGKYPEAIEYSDKALAIDPNDINALYNKGNSLYEQRKYPEAIGYLDKSLDINPNFIGALNNKGLVLYEQRKYPEAIEYYDKALAIDPNFIDALNNKGLALLEQGKYPEAIEYYDKALAIDPNFIDTLNNKGLALSRQGKNQEAIECFNKALEIDPTYALAKYNKKIILKRLSMIKGLSNLERLSKDKTNPKNYSGDTV